MRPVFFSTTTIGEHHSVGSVIGDMIPFDTMRFSSSCSGFSSGADMRLGVGKLYGCASGLSFILTASPFMRPNSPKTSGLISSTNFSMPIAWAAPRLSSRDRDAPAMTHTGKQYFLFLWVVVASNWPTQFTLPPGLVSGKRGGLRTGLGDIRS